MKFKDQNFLVYGLSKSGIASARLIRTLGGKVSLFDDDEGVYDTPAVKELLLSGCERCENFPAAQVVVVSPGVAIDNKNLIEAKKNGARIIGELELSSLLLKSPMIAVTGTNGKTTTATLIHHILKSGGENSYLLGNVGVPLAAEVLNLSYNDVAVVEVSSFQAETLCSFTPHIGVLLNVTEDHLDRHYNMENYRFLKGKILSNMQRSEWAVLNRDDPVVREISNTLKCRKVWFSLKERVDGAYLDGENMVCGGNVICNVSEMKIQGAHNVANALAASLAAKLYGVDDGKIAEALKTFRGVPHRVEKIRTIGNISYINDSKATNQDSCIKGVESIEGPVAVILGGVSKGQDYTELFETFKLRKNIWAVIMGSCKEQMVKTAAAVGFTNIICAENLSEAVNLATVKLQCGGNVILSPASASFDMFENYEKRGEEFCKIVRGLDEKSLQG